MSADTATQSRLRSRRRRASASQSGVILALSVLAGVGLFPYLFMLLSSFKTNEQFYQNFWGLSLPLEFGNYAVAWQQVNPYLTTSLIVAAASTIGTIALGATSAYVLARYRFLGRNVLFAFVAVLMMIPNIASIIPLFVLVRDLGILNTYWVLIIPQVASGLVLAIILMKTFFEGVPQELFDAAKIDGASGPRLFRSILLPLSSPIIGTVALMTVISVWNDFFWPLLTISDDSLRTVPVGLSFFQGQNATEWGPLFAGYAISSIPLLLLFVFLSKWFLAGLQGGIAGVAK
ncbi:carbohydrate ABC transporter permease [Jiangella endophytica]|uniref:carbohydrate ABC transporter permease n=1 Tax=Jiangella endophytica TaxID=1623398 RepID=UPI0018E4F654|nr:carbohydrate ABC transporter permease [Jiangella endophytica]